MLKNWAVISVVSLGMLSAAGCRSQNRMESHQEMTAEVLKLHTQVPADQLPADVIKAVHQHVLQPSIIHGTVIEWKGKMAYAVYVKSGNTVYIERIRPDGLYLNETIDQE